MSDTLPFLPAVTPAMRFFDDNGKPVSDGKVYTFLGDTTEPLPTYANAEGTTLNPFPAPLSAGGEVVLYLDPQFVYRFEIRRSDESPVRSFKVQAGIVTLDSLSSGVLDARFDSVLIGVQDPDQNAQASFDNATDRSAFGSDQNKFHWLKSRDIRNANESLSLAYGFQNDSTSVVKHAWNVGGVTGAKLDGSGLSLNKALLLSNNALAVGNSPVYGYLSSFAAGLTGNVRLGANNGEIRFATSGVDVIDVAKFSQNGSLHIGDQTIPDTIGSRVLSLNGQTESLFVASVNNTEAGYIFADSGLALNVGATNSLVLETGAVPRVTINGVGNVGVGTSTPASRLHVQGNNVGGTRLTVSNTDPNGFPGIDVAGTRTLRFEVDNPNLTAMMKTVDNTPLLFGVNNIERVRLQTNGNNHFVGNLTNTLGSGYFASGADSTSVGWNNIGGEMRFRTNNIDQARIDTSGRLAVGPNLAPSHLLHVSNNSASNGTLARIGNNTSSLYFSVLSGVPYISSDTSQNNSIYLDPTAATIAFQTNGLNRVMLNGNGQMLVGPNNFSSLRTLSVSSATGAGANPWNAAQLGLDDTRAMAQGVGGTMVFTGNFETTPTGNSTFAWIRGSKLNGTSGNSSGSLRMGARGGEILFFNDQIPTIDGGSPIAGFATNANFFARGAEFEFGPVAGGAVDFSMVRNQRNANCFDIHKFNGTTYYSQQTGQNFGAIQDVSAGLNFIWRVAGTERARLNGAGNLGLGTETPGNAISVVRPAASPAYAEFAGNNAVAASLLVGQDATGLARIHQNGANPVTIWTNGVERVRVDATGKVGVNTASPQVSLHVNGTDAARVPVGTTAQRPAGANGDVRYNTTEGSYEGYSGTDWAPLGGAIKGVFYENKNTLTESYTIRTGYNAMSAGPISVANGVVVTVPSGSTWTVV